MEKIKNILDTNRDKYAAIEIYYSSSWNKLAGDKRFITSDSLGFGELANENIKIGELWADDTDILTQNDYEMYFADHLGCMFCEDIYGDDKRDILIIWLSKLSYRIASDPRVKTVADFRLQNIGKFHECIVVHPPVVDTRRNNYDDDDDFEEYDLSDVDEENDNDGAMFLSEPQPVAKIKVGAKSYLDGLYASECYLVDNVDDLPFFIDSGGNDTWWEKETAAKHFGNPEAKVLVIVLV